MKTLTDSDLNLAMAEWMGWYKIHGAEVYEWSWMNKNGSGCNDLPDYLSDDSPRRLLNEAEARLTKEQQKFYFEALKDVVDIDSDEFISKWMLELVGASARQRTIAILKTVKPEIFT